MPKLKPYWLSPTMNQISASVRRFHEVLIANANPKAIEQSRVELGELEALTLTRFSHDLLMKRLSSPQEPVQEILQILHKLVAKLVHFNKIDEAWQLLIDASRCIRGFGDVNDGIIPRLAMLLPFKLRNAPTDQSTLLSSNHFPICTIFTFKRTNQLIQLR